MKKWIFCFIMTLVSVWSFCINAMDSDEEIRRADVAPTAAVSSSRKIIKSEWGNQDIGLIGEKYIDCVSLLLAKNTGGMLVHAAVVFQGYGDLAEPLLLDLGPTASKRKSEYQNEEGEIWAVGFDMREDGVQKWNYKSIQNRFLPDYKTENGEALTYTVPWSQRIIRRDAAHAIYDALGDSDSGRSIGCGAHQIKYCLCGGCLFQKFCCGPKLYNCASYVIRVLKSAKIHVPLCVNRVCFNLICDCGMRSCIFGSLESLQDKANKTWYKNQNKLNKIVGDPPLSTRKRVAHFFRWQTNF